MNTLPHNIQDIIYEFANTKEVIIKYMREEVFPCFASELQIVGTECWEHDGLYETCECDDRIPCFLCFFTSDCKFPHSMTEKCSYERIIFNASPRTLNIIHDFESGFIQTNTINGE